MQRGEIEGRGASWVSVQLAMPDAIADGRIKPIVFASITREPSAPDVPTLAELIKDPVQRQVAEFRQLNWISGAASSCRPTCRRSVLKCCAPLLKRP